MRFLRHRDRLSADAKHRSSAIAKLNDLAMQQRAIATLLEVPATVLGSPIDTFGHAVHRAVTENA